MKHSFTTATHTENLKFKVSVSICWLDYLQSKRSSHSVHAGKEVQMLSRSICVSWCFVLSSAYLWSGCTLFLNSVQPDTTNKTALPLLLPLCLLLHVFSVPIYAYSFSMYRSAHKSLQLSTVMEKVVFLFWLLHVVQPNIIDFLYLWCSGHCRAMFVLTTNGWCCCRGGETFTVWW